MVYPADSANAVYDPLSARSTQDPYPCYAALRVRDPAHRSCLLNSRVFSRHADVDAILRDHRRFSSDPDKFAPSRSGSRVKPEDDARTMLVLDPPNHTRLRALANKAFASGAIDAFEPRIRAIAGELFDGIADPSSFDILRAVAHPFPALVIAEMLGIDGDGRDQIRKWSDSRARLLEPVMESLQTSLQAQVIGRHFRALIKRRREAPKADIVTALAKAEAGGGTLGEQEAVNLLRLLLVTGSESTADFIGNALFALLRHPELLARLRADPGLVPAAVEELLRYDTSIQTAFRNVAENTDFRGVRLRRGERVVLLIGSANRDAAAFADPDRLRLDRPPNSHMTFGRGIHYCIGAPLARLEVRVLLETLLERFESISLLNENESPRFRTGLILRGLHSLPVSAARKRQM